MKTKSNLFGKKKFVAIIFKQNYKTGYKFKLAKFAAFSSRMP